MFHPKISIIIPVYNGADYMREAIDSALAQTYDNCEVIVINDGSTDGGETDSIAKSYGDKIRYIWKENGGVATALNAGIDAAAGEYISWLSHDDVYLPHKLETQIAALVGEDPCTIVYCGYDIIDKKSHRTGSVTPGALYPCAKLQIPLFPLLRGLINGCTLLIHKSHFTRIGHFDPSLRTTQDYVLWFDIFRHAKIKYIEENLIQTRIHEKQGSRSMSCYITEGNALWISMMLKMTTEEKCAIDGNPYAFYKRTETFLRNTSPYAAAANKARDLASEAEAAMRQYASETLVSVVITFFNRIVFLLESINSVLTQTHKNIELILVDDASTEDLSALMKKITGNDRIRYFRQLTQRPSAARNLGLREANGEYIAFLDSDDLFEQDKIARQLEFMLSNGFVFSHTSYQRIGIDGSPLEIMRSGCFSGKVFPSIIGGCPIATPTVMVHRDVLGKTLFPEGGRIGEDGCTWIDLSFTHECGGLDIPLTRVRVSEASSTIDSKKLRMSLLNLMHYAASKEIYSRYENELYELSYQYMLTFQRQQETIRKYTLIETNAQLTQTKLIEVQAQLEQTKNELEQTKNELEQTKNELIQTKTELAAAMRIVNHPLVVHQRKVWHLILRWRRAIKQAHT